MVIALAPGDYETFNITHVRIKWYELEKMRSAMSKDGWLVYIHEYCYNDGGNIKVVPGTAEIKSEKINNPGIYTTLMNFSMIPATNSKVDHIKQSIAGWLEWNNTFPGTVSGNVIELTVPLNITVTHIRVVNIKEVAENIVEGIPGYLEIWCSKCEGADNERPELTGIPFYLPGYPSNEYIAAMNGNTEPASGAKISDSFKSIEKYLVDSGKLSGTVS